MNRFNISVLLATALLGVLLWIVLSMARDLARAPDEPLPMPGTEEVFDPALPRLMNYQDMETWLESRGQDGSKLMSDYRRWLQERGFPVVNLPLLPPAERDPAYTPRPDYSGLDDTTLLDYAGNGNSGAMYELANRSLNTDPLAALEWSEQAIIAGSLYAMVRTADLLTTLSDPAINSLSAEPIWKEALDQIRTASPAPLERALAWSIALETIGGYAVMSSEHAQRIEALSTQLDSGGIARACEQAQDYVLEIAGSRRAQGNTIFDQQQPPFALSVAEPAAVIPCNVTVPPLVTMNDCAATDFVGPGPRLMTAWVCPL